MLGHKYFCNVNNLPKRSDDFGSQILGVGIKEDLS